MPEIPSGSIYDKVSQVSKMSLDTMDQEARDFFKNYYGIEFLNSTSNQAICFSNWSGHPEVVLEAISNVNKSFKDIPTSVLDENFDDYISEIIYQSIAITGRNQLTGIKGRILSQVLPSYAYKTDEVYKDAMRIISAYEKIGIDRSKLYIKIPVTWESMQAAKKLKAEENVDCLGTVVHSLEQAIIAAEANCAVISPYVDDLETNLDPSTYVRGPLEANYGYNETVKIHKYYKAHNVKTIICVAATIGIDVIMGLSGIDEITVPVVALHKMLNFPVPSDVTVPNLKSSYSTEEAEKVETYIDDREKYYASLNTNPTAQKRIKFACDTFMSFDDKAHVLIKNILIEFKGLKQY